MKESRYNVVTPYKDVFIHFNMVTKAIVISSSANVNVNEKEFVSNGFLVDNEYDELLAAETKFRREQYNQSHLLLTIVPTLRCNLNCIYCYQSMMHEDAGIIDDDTLTGIQKQLLNEENLNSVHVDWNGGEPLLAIEKIHEFSQAVVSICKSKGISYTSAINTNLYSFSDIDMSMLVDSKIQSISTTLAGNQDTHNQYRLTRGSAQGTFTDVWNNIEKALKVLPVDICINVTRNSEEGVALLIEELSRINCSNLHITLLAVEDNGISDKRIFLDEGERFRVLLALLEKFISRGFSAEVSSNFSTKSIYCGAQMIHSYMIHPNGNIHKCSSDFCSTNRIGRVDKNGFQITRIHELFNPYLNKECLACAILPYCNGGCHYCRELGIDCCPYEKENLPELLRLYVESVYRKQLKQI